MAKKWVYMVSYHFNDGDKDSFGSLEVKCDERLNSIEKIRDIEKSLEDRSGSDCVVIIAINYLGRG